MKFARYTISKQSLLHEFLNNHKFHHRDTVDIFDIINLCMSQLIFYVNVEEGFLMNFDDFSRTENRN